MKKIMVIDDDIEFLDEVSEFLEVSGYKVITSNNGRNALTNAYNENVDLIILDLKLGEENGFHIADELKRSFKTSHIPIIAVTGKYIEPEYISLLEMYGFVNRFIKPVNPMDILYEIDKNTC